MSGIRRLNVADLTASKTKGKPLVAAVNKMTGSTVNTAAVPAKKGTKKK